MTDKTRGILLVLGFLTVSATAAGCGGDGNDLAQFTGTWKYNQAMAMGTLSCPGSPDQTGGLGATKVLNQGSTSDLVDMTPALFDPTTQCFYTFDVKGKVATIRPGQMCSLTDGVGDPLVDETPTSWTFTLTSATTADEVFITSLPPCTLTAMATLDKVAASN